MIDRIPARLASSTERFEAWVLDVLVIWFGGVALTVISAILSVSPYIAPYIATAVGMTWLLLNLAADAIFGFTIGRRNGYLNLRCIDGAMPTRSRLLGRAFVHRLWLWPLLVLVCVALSHGFVHWPYALARLLERVCWRVSLLGMGVAAMDFIGFGLTGLTFADRLSGTRLMVAEPGPTDEPWR